MAEKERDEDHLAEDSPTKRAAEQVKAEGARILKQTQSRAEAFAGNRQDDATNYLKAVASAVECGAQELSRSGYDGSALVLARAAEGCDSLADGVSDRKPGDFVKELQSFAHSRPGVFLGAAFLVGLGAARFMVSSADSQDDEAAAAVGPAS